MALYHFHLTQIKRSEGKTAMAAAAYRAGEKLHSDYYGFDYDYTRKSGVVHTEIILPPHAPKRSIPVTGSASSRHIHASL